jgi:N-acyl-D-amino-acid deacylase
MPWMRARDMLALVVPGRPGYCKYYAPKGSDKGGIVLDLKICNGTIVDGTGKERFVGDVGVRDGLIVEVKPGGGITAEAAETVDATGLAVLPGWVDVHSHYDGQVTWDGLLEPSSGHGVTTVVMGNCGVGFAPVETGREEWLIGLMEGVEDIPGSALSEGMTWGWNTVPEYMDVLDKSRLAVDVAAQVAHGPLRAYVMGDRGARNEPATPEDVAAMARIVQEAIEAGALGFSTSRELGHRAIDGEVVPGTFADAQELFELARAAKRGGRSVFEVAPRGASGLEHESAAAELDWMSRLALEVDLPVSFLLFQVKSNPSLWRQLMEGAAKAVAGGAEVRAQVAARPFGMMLGLKNHHVFSARPTYRRLASQHSFAELVEQLRRPDVKAAILAESDLPAHIAPPASPKAGSMRNGLEQLYFLGDPPDYEPGPERRVAAMAEAAGEDLLSFVYDLLLGDNGERLLMFPIFNFVDGNHDAIYEMLSHPNTISGAADGGAHCSVICDASYPTYLLSHWARDRSRGPRLPVEFLVRKQTSETAHLYGLGDRGVLAAGKRADINVIDLDSVQIRPPRVVDDLPAGGSRVLQEAVGYRMTVVSGTVTRREGVDTGARPGRLIRGAR